MPVRSSKEVLGDIFKDIDPDAGEAKPDVVKTLESLMVRDVMEKRFVMVHPKTTIKEAMSVFTDKNIDGAPIVQDGLLKGILTNQDIIQTFEEKALELSHHRHGAANYEKAFREIGKKRVSTISRPKTFVFPNTSIFDAMTVMDENNLELVAVMDESSMVRGVIKDDRILQTLLQALM